MIDRETCERIVFEDESYQIQGAVFEVYKEMGCGYLETVYQECLEYEFMNRKIPFVSQQGITVYYKDKPLKQKFVPDFICYDKIIIEIKAVQTLAPGHNAQVLNYLKTTSLDLGLLINFGSYPKTEIVRIANTNFSRFSR